MKPTLDEEIKVIAKLSANDILHKSSGHDDDLQIVLAAIRAGIEAWKRQEPSLEILNAANERMWEGVKPLRQGTIEFELWRQVYKTMMSTSLRTSETTGEEMQ